MTLTLATAWHPRGEYARFETLLPTLGQVYAEIIIALPPETDAALVQKLQTLSSDRLPVIVRVASQWPSGRYLALHTALERGAEYVQYVDFDRLLRWVETRPEEWRRTAAAVCETDCLVIGRSPQAYQTHPRALVQSEAISNRVASHFLGREMDISAGSKGLSRRALEVVVARSSPVHPFAADVEWPLLVKQAGYDLRDIEVDGLDWESADRYKARAADSDGQRRAAEAYDADPQNWEYRVRVALEIVDAALRTANSHYSGDK